MNIHKKHLVAASKSTNPFAYRDRIIADGATYYWRLGEASGPALDSVGGANGTLVGSVTRNVTGPGVDKATQFTGVGSFTLPSFTIPLVCTVELWIKTVSVQQFNVMFTNRTTAQSTNYLIMLQDGQPMFNCNGNGTSPPSFFINNGNWHHIVGRSDGTTISIYIDSVSKDSRAGVFKNTTNTGYIGTDDFSPNSVATIADIAIYPRVLTPTEISQHYALRLA